MGTDDYQKLSAKELENKIRELENKMYQHARDLEFEQAANVRDQVQALRAQFIANS